ncbi:hypothetical protein H8958_020297 [Nasalis larvatus]
MEDLTMVETMELRWLARSHMAEENKTLVTHFVLTGLTDRPGLQVLLFLVFLVIYLITLNHMLYLAECATQFYLFGSNATTECFLLVVMAYDRYVAICNPLLYPVVMSNVLCTQFIDVSYFIGFLHSVILVAFIQVFTLMTLIVSYSYILSAIPKKKGRSKAFSTCSAHLFSVSLFYGTLFFMLYLLFSLVQSPE